MVDASVPNKRLKCSQLRITLLRITSPSTSSMPMQSMCAPELCLMKSWIVVPSKRTLRAGVCDWYAALIQFISSALLFGPTSELMYEMFDPLRTRNVRIPTRR